MGHKLYQIQRKSDFIHDIARLHKNDSNYNNYQSKKILSLIQNGKIDTLGKELIWRPNIVLSMIKDYKPMLRETSPYSLKIFELYLSSLFHYAQDILGIKSGKEFLEKYFNFGNCNFDLIKNEFFWGIDTRKMKYESQAYQMIELIMKNDHFKGITQMNNQQAKIITHCCTKDCFHYLSLIVKYGSKNEGVVYLIVACICLFSRHSSIHPKFCKRHNQSHLKKIIRT